MSEHCRAEATELPDGSEYQPSGKQRSNTQWLDVQQDWPVDWVDQLGINDNVALVSLDQLRAMRREIEDVLQKYRRVGQGNPEAKRVAVYTYAYPVDLDQSPRGDRS